MMDGGPSWGHMRPQGPAPRAALWGKADGQGKRNFLQIQAVLGAVSVGTPLALSGSPSRVEEHARFIIRPPREAARVVQPRKGAIL